MGLGFEYGHSSTGPEQVQGRRQPGESGADNYYVIGGPRNGVHPPEATRLGQARCRLARPGRQYQRKQPCQHRCKDAVTVTVMKSPRCP